MYNLYNNYIKIIQVIYNTYDILFFISWVKKRIIVNINCKIYRTIKNKIKKGGQIMSTIMNKKKIEIFKELQEYRFPEETIKYRQDINKYYIPDSELTKVFRQFVPVGFYNLKEQVVETEVKGATGVRCHLTLEILDDDGNITNIFEQDGYSEAIFPKNSERQTSHANNIAGAITDAWKRLLKNQFGLGEAQLELKNSEISAGGTIYVVSAKKNTAYGDKGTFLDISTEGRADLNRLAIFSNKTENFKKMFPTGIPSGTLISIFGYEKKDQRGNNQIIFTGFAGNSGQPAASQQTSMSVVTASNLVVTNGIGQMTASSDTGEVINLVFDRQGLDYLRNAGYLESFQNSGDKGFKFISKLEVQKEGSYLFKNFA